MSKINIDKILKSSPVSNLEITDPGIVISPSKARDEFIAPAPPTKSSGWFGKKRGLKLAGELLEKVERIPQTPEEMARYYFDADLRQLIALGESYPSEIKTMIERSKLQSANRRETEPWYFLIEAACGETRPLFQAFEKLDLKKRLALFRTTLFSPHIGNGQMVGELFAKLMESTTPEEQERWVEPTLHSILNRGAWSTNPKVQNKLAWLKAFYHGWEKEAKELC